MKEGKKISPTHGGHEEVKHTNDHDAWAHEVQDHYKHQESEHHDTPLHHNPHETPYHEQDYSSSSYVRDDRGWYWTPESESPKDTPASSYKTETARFEDLHTRITQMNHQLDILFHDLTTFKQETEERHRDLKHYIYGYAESHKHMLEKIEGVLEKVQVDIAHNDYQGHFESLHQTLEHGNQAVLGMPQAVHSSKCLFIFPSSLSAFCYILT